MLRTDNGGEFCSTKFDKFSKENDIEIHKITSYTPSYNGFSEWMNKTSMERARIMLSGVGLEQKF